MNMDHDSGNHALCDPDVCFAAKCAYWRTQGVPLQFTYGRQQFHGPTIRERLAETRSEYKRRNGVDPVPLSEFE